MPTGFLHTILAAVVVALVVLIYRRMGKRPVAYTLAQPWTYAPILWAAVDEVVPGGHGHGDSHGEGADAVNVGGGASGRW